MPDVARKYLLAIDTSTERAGIALFDGSLVAEDAWLAGRSHTTTVLPRMAHMLEAAGITIGEIGGIGVATGPGTFTGLRVGLSIAKGLVLGGVPNLIGISTLDAIAEPLRDVRARVLALIPAGRGRLVWSMYANGHAGAPVNGTRAEFLAGVTAQSTALLKVTGEIDDDLRRDLAQIPGHLDVVVVPDRQIAVARLAWDRWQRSDVDDPARLQATYVHGRPSGSP